MILPVGKTKKSRTVLMNRIREFLKFTLVMGRYVTQVDFFNSFKGGRKHCYPAATFQGDLVDNFTSCQS